MSQREYPLPTRGDRPADQSLEHLEREGHRRAVDTHRPWTPIQALMETAPHAEPETSRLELLAMRDAIADAIEQLDDVERFIFTAVVVERRPLRSWEPGWPHTTVARIRDNACRQLAALLEDHPSIRTYLEDK